MRREKPLRSLKDFWKKYKIEKPMPTDHVRSYLAYMRELQRQKERYSGGPLCYVVQKAKDHASTCGCNHKLLCDIAAEFGIVVV